MSIAQSPAYEEIYFFLASAPTHEEILTFRPSPAVQERIKQLLETNKVSRLTEQEQAELDEFEQVEHFVRMLKLHTQLLIEKK